MTREVPFLTWLPYTAGFSAAPERLVPTDGRDGILDALRGSHSEQVPRRVPRPLLAVPSA